MKYWFKRNWIWVILISLFIVWWKFPGILQKTKTTTDIPAVTSEVYTTDQTGDMKPTASAPESSSNTAPAAKSSTTSTKSSTNSTTTTIIKPDPALTKKIDILTKKVDALQKTTAPAQTSNTTPTPAPSTVMDDGRMWSINAAGQMVWIGPENGSADIHQMGTWLDYIRSGHTAKFTTTVPGTVIITVGKITGSNNINQFFTGGSNVIPIPTGTYTIEFSNGSSGGFRWTPDPGFGWRK